LTAAGAVVGLLFAVWTVNLFELRAAGAASVLELGTGLRPVVVVFAVALSLLTTLITGLVPALAATRPDLIAVIKQGTASIGATPPRRRMRSALAATQIGLSLLLVIGAACFCAAWRNCARLSPRC
jgi:putative ABC transport system permease protein